jgi:hypothetical protein
MNIEELVGDIVLLVLKPAHPLQGLGIRQDKTYVRLLGNDRFGVWVELPDFHMPQLQQTGAGPEQEQKADACALVPWGAIMSIVAFPDLKGFDYPQPELEQIGFHSD